jgi:hypothetical protein
MTTTSSFFLKVADFVFEQLRSGMRRLAALARMSAPVRDDEEGERSSEVAGGASGNTLDDGEVAARVAKVASDYDFGDGSDERKMAVMDAIGGNKTFLAAKKIADMHFLRPEARSSLLSEPKSGSWHPAVLSIRNAVLALAVVNTDRLHKSRQRTSQIQDWTVGVGWEGALAVKGCLLEDESVVANIEWDAYATRRRF